MTPDTQAALLSVLRSIHQGAEAAMHLLMESSQAPVQAEKPRKRYMGDAEEPPPATTPPEGAE